MAKRTEGGRAGQARKKGCYMLVLPKLLTIDEAKRVTLPEEMMYCSTITFTGPEHRWYLLHYYFCHAKTGDAGYDLPIYMSCNTTMERFLATADIVKGVTGASRVDPVTQDRDILKCTLHVGRRLTQADVISHAEAYAKQFEDVSVSGSYAGVPYARCRKLGIPRERFSFIRYGR